MATIAHDSDNVPKLLLVDSDGKLILREDVLRMINLPTRLTSDLGASGIAFSHGTVAADFTLDSATEKTQSATYNLYITDMSLDYSTDPTAEVAVQEIPCKCSITDTTDSQWRGRAIFSIPSNCHISFNTPIKIAKGHNWRTDLYLGGATNLSLVVVINGFESAD